MCCTWFFSGRVLALGLLGKTKYAALSCLPVDLFCVSADWIASLFKSFLILTKTIAVLWHQGIPEVTGTLYILWFTAQFASWKPQFVSVCFPCFVWVSDASSAPPDHDRVWGFSALVEDFRQGLWHHLPISSANTPELRVLRTWALSLLVFPFPAAVDDTVSDPELLFACAFHLALLAWEKREKKPRKAIKSLKL